jgi:hypothetical protein
MLSCNNFFNTGVAKQFSAQWIVFRRFLAQTSFKAFNKTVLLECLVNKQLLLIASPMKDIKLKEEVLREQEHRCAIGNGIYYRQGDSDAATFTKRRRRFDEQYFKRLVQGFFRNYIMPIPGIGTAIGRSRISQISGLFKSKKMKKRNRTLTGEQDRMFASASAKSRLAGRTLH